MIIRLPDLKWLGLLILLFLFGCGESDGVGGLEPVAEGRFVIYPNTQIRYVSGDRSGNLDEDGAFRFYPGKDISFYFGSLYLGKAPGQANISPFDFYEEPLVPGENNLNRMNVARFLMMFEDVSSSDFIIQAQQDVFAVDICQSLDWGGKSYRIVWDSPHDDDGCVEEGVEGATLLQLTPEIFPEDKSIFSLSDEAFESHPGLVNAGLWAYGQTPLITYDRSKGVWCSGFSGLPYAFWSYQREMVNTDLQRILIEDAVGNYACTFDGSGFSGELNIRITPSAMGLQVANKPSGINQCNGYDVTVYGHVDTDSRIEFDISNGWLNFRGSFFPDYHFAGSFYECYGCKDALGTFRCQGSGLR